MTNPTMTVPMTGSARDSLIAICVLWVLFAATVGFRLYGRHRSSTVGADDILSVVALALSGTTIGFNVVVFTAGVGYDLDPKSPVFLKLMNNLPLIMQFTFIFVLCYIWCLACLKMSQLALYLRVFRLQLRYWVYAVGAVVIIWALVFNFLFIFLCDPISQQWTLLRTGHCLDQILLLKCLIITNLVTDLMVLVLPIRTVWQLQMRKTEKLAVLACFGLGFACVIISLARFIEMFVIDLLGNLTGTSLNTFMLCSVELMLAGLCINIPMLRPFYLQWRKKYRSQGGSATGRSSKMGFNSRSGLASGMKSGTQKSWIELTDGKDKSTATIVHDDSSSERKLYDEEAADYNIHVSRKVQVTRD